MHLIIEKMLCKFHFVTLPLACHCFDFRPKHRAPARTSVQEEDVVVLEAPEDHPEWMLGAEVTDDGRCA